MKIWFLIALIVFPVEAFSAGELQLLSVTKSGASESYSVSIQVLAIMTLLTMLPAGVIMMTSFTRIIVVLAILRQALGMVSTPSSQILIGLALFMTIFIMSPVFKESYAVGLKPYMEDKMELQTSLEKAAIPVKKFMLSQTREKDLSMFAEISGLDAQTENDVSLTLLIPAFITSELKTAFQIGFLLFIPFLIIDLVVASVLMAMGMMMLSPMMISLPFKIMLFVLVDGWTLILGTLAGSFF